MSERDLFTAAREMTDPVARGAYLDRACDGDTGLRCRVDALLRAHDQPNSLLDHPVVSLDTPNPADTRTLGYESGAGNADEVPLAFLEPSSRPDSLGRIGHYEVLQVLGRGAFGIVFRAFDDILQRVVAIKVMAPQLAATSPARKRFLREAQSSAKVRHENVVQVYEIGEQPLPYLAMEFIPGETLHQRLNRTGPLDVPETLRIGRQIAEGLAAAHATDLIHRDIKPSNILIESGPQERAKLTDFGLARAADDASISQSGIIAGTPMFMAPEQALGAKLDQRADLFSLGSVLYQMAAGRPPFRANSTVAVLKRVAEDTPRDIREIIPETPQWLCNIIAKLHEKNPVDRYQTAREVADVLADCESQLKTHSRLKDSSRIPQSKSAAGRSGRRKWVMAAALVAFALLAASYWVVSTWPAKGTLEFELAGGVAHGKVTLNRQGNGTTAGADDVAILDLASQRQIELEPGEYTLNVQLETMPTGAGVLWFPKTVKVARSQRATIRIEWKDAVAPKNDANAEPKAPLPSGRFALAFDGQKSQVRIPSLKFNDDHALTVEAWTVVSGAPLQGRGYDLVATSGFGGFALCCPLPQHGGNRERLAFLVRQKSTDSYVHAWEKQPVPRDELVHVAGVYDGKAEIRFYVNGQLQSRTPIQGSKPSTQSVRLGSNAGGRAALLGRMNGVRLSKVARYEADFTPAKRWEPDANTIALYHFDEGKGMVLKDSSGNGHHGEIVGAMWVKTDGSEIGASPEVPKTAADVLSYLPGNWKVERREINPKMPSKQLHSAGVATYDWVAGGKLLRSRHDLANEEFGQPLVLYAIDARTKSLRRWFFWSSGRTFGPIPGLFNPTSRTLLWTHGIGDETHSHINFDFDDSDTMRAQLYRQDAKDKLVHEVEMKFRRTLEPVTPAKMPIDPKQPAEVKVLEQLVGEWRNEVKVKTADKPGQESIEIVRVQAESILGGRFIEVIEHNETTNGSDYSLIWFDEKRKEYRQWACVGNGLIHELTGTWSEAEKTLRWVAPGGLEGHWKFQNENQGEFERKVVGADGKINMEAKGVSRRVASSSLPPTHKNSIGMEFVRVPKGKSWLGGGKDKLGDKEVEIPADFYLGRYEVTQEEWETLMGENPSWFSRTVDANAVKDIPDADVKRLPVESVSWEQCQVFVEQLNSREKQTGWVYRLPTEREWEYACRGGPLPDKSKSAFYFYFDEPINTLTEELANYADSGLERTCKVGSYKPNALGLYDMHGNVWEWCQDEVKDDKGASQRAHRGGGWFNASKSAWAANRNSSDPARTAKDIGLRLVRVPAGAPSPEAKTPPAVAPFTDAEIQRIAALPAAEQVAEVRKELMRRNPAFALQSLKGASPTSLTVLAGGGVLAALRQGGVQVVLCRWLPGQRRR